MSNTCIVVGGGVIPCSKRIFSDTKKS